MSVNVLQDVRDYMLQADFTSFPPPLTATLLAFAFSSRDGLADIDKLFLTVSTSPKRTVLLFL